jgi:hypothetical protein
MELLRLRNVVAGLVLDENLGDAEGRHGGHAGRPLALDRTAEAARPVERIEEANDDIAIDSFLHTLQTGTTAQELLELQAPIVVDDLVVRKNHEERTELDSTIRVSRHEHLLIKGVHPGPSPADLIYGDFVELCV